MRKARILLTIDIDDKAWEQIMEPIDNHDGTFHQPSISGLIEDAVHYTSGWLLIDGVKVTGTLA